MTRPRIEGMDERIINSFLERNIYDNQREVISAALRALVREQKMKEASEMPAYSDETYAQQLTSETGAQDASVLAAR
jgi:Arc/MetJ-type ribon-helix-helix transcriptional regulator